MARLLKHPSELLATVVLGNTVANALVVAIGLGVTLWLGGSVMLTVGALALLILVGCEALPKTLAVRSPETWSLRVARPISWVQSVRPSTIARQVPVTIPDDTERLCVALISMPTAMRPAPPCSAEEMEPSDSPSTT